MSKAGRKPFGWYDYEMAVIKQLFLKVRLRPHGKKMTFKSIAESLNKDGHKTQTGKPWYPIAVGRIIRKGEEYYKTIHAVAKNRFRIPKKNLTAGDYLTKEQVTKCRAVLRPSDSVVFETLLGSGPRASECCALEVGDISIYDGASQIEVRRGKGSKQRSVHIGPRLKEILTKYLEERPALKLVVKETPLFVNQRWKQLTYSDLYSRIRKIRERSDVNCLHPHALRHTFGTFLYNYKKDLEYVREQLGHSHITTTQIYAKTLSDEKIEQMNGFEQSLETKNNAIEHQ